MSDLHEWAREFTQEHQNSIDYFMNFGSPVEKALVSKVVELANK